MLQGAGEISESAWGTVRSVLSEVAIRAAIHPFVPVGVLGLRIPEFPYTQFELAAVET